MFRRGEGRVEEDGHHFVLGGGSGRDVDGANFVRAYMFCGDSRRPPASKAEVQYFYVSATCARYKRSVCKDIGALTTSIILAIENHSLLHKASSVLRCPLCPLSQTMITFQALDKQRCRASKKMRSTKKDAMPTKNEPNPIHANNFCTTGFSQKLTMRCRKNMAQYMTKQANVNPRATARNAQVTAGGIARTELGVLVVNTGIVYAGEI